MACQSLAKKAYPLRGATPTRMRFPGRHRVEAIMRMLREAEAHPSSQHCQHCQHCFMGPALTSLEASMGCFASAPI